MTFEMPPLRRAADNGGYGDDYWLQVAIGISGAARCTRRNVGAVLVKDNKQVSAGVNMAAPGFVDCIEGGCPRGRQGFDRVPKGAPYDNDGPGRCVAVHAEAYAIIRAGIDAQGCTLYCTDEPCFGCEKLIRAAGIKRVRTPSLVRTF